MFKFFDKVPASRPPDPQLTRIQETLDHIATLLEDADNARARSDSLRTVDAIHGHRALSPKPPTR